MLLKKALDKLLIFVSFAFYYTQWSNLRLSSVTFATKMHTIASEVRKLFCNKVLQYHQRKIQSLYDTASESNANIAITALID